jgi:hypothetical protein
MSNKNLSRREFLRLGALTAAGVVMAGCAVPQPTEPKEEGEEPEVSADVPEQEVVTLDVMSPVAEYEGAYREIWNVFEASHPHIKINLFSINEDTAAAHEAKVAGGYLPAFENTQEMQIFFNKDNYEMAVNLGETDFKWWDRWTYDVKNAWSDLHGLPGPRSLDIYQGFVMTWQYNADLMEQAGLDPQNDVKTWDDLEKWLDEGTAWANATEDVDYFWNQAWHNWVFAMNYMDMIPLAWEAGSRERQVDCWLGRAKFNDPDSPYRFVYDFYVKANERGWMPESMWTRQWEGDMEAGYIGGTSVMMMHGPWVWDKALAAGSTFTQAGLPLTPPADTDVWKQGALPPTIDAQYFIRAGVPDLPEWPQILEAWNWFFSPEAVPMRAQAEGRFPMYKLDEPLDLKGPQYQAVLKEIGTEGGKWEACVFEEDLTGVVLAGPYRKKGSKGVWDWESNGNNAVFADLLSGKITVQDALDIAQRNWEESYEGLPA